MPFTFRQLEIPGVLAIEPKLFEDVRGFFMETYKREEFKKAGIPQIFVQDNHSRSRQGVLRGFHFQKEPKAQGKLVRCLRGAIFDVAVDLRRGSPSYRKWIGIVLSEENRLMLWIPRGFAHGYLTLHDGTEVVYKVDNPYSMKHECGIRWDDPEIAVKWPIERPIVSAKDGGYPFLKNADFNFNY
jgi:dTDP-4-dehydrorhamnose 3,5-epimerase